MTQKKEKKKKKKHMGVIARSPFFSPNIDHKSPKKNAADQSTITEKLESNHKTA
jgi:hypothetical protein